MSLYRLSRNVEASFIDYVAQQLTADGWHDIRTEKSFAEVYKGTLPCICINVLDRPVNKLEIGSTTIFKDLTVEIRIFATSDGQRLDLADWLIDKVLPGIVYYQYEVVSGVVSHKTNLGRINILAVPQHKKELVNTENLVKEDRYRHLITLDCRVALI